MYMVSSLVFTGLIAIFTIPTIFAGRDQGSLSAAAIQLVQDHTLISHSLESTTFFEINQRGKALNFPGFHYTPDGGLLTQFPLPYTTFIAGFYGICRTSGFILANAILLFLFLISLIHCARTLLNEKFTRLFFITLLTSFTIGWFAKFTLSENMMSALLWSGIALLFMLRKDPSKLTYMIFLSTITLLVFTRIEGVWFSVILFGLALHDTPHMRTIITRDLWTTIFLPAALLCAIGFTIMIMSQPFLTTMVHALIDATAKSSTSSLHMSEKYGYLLYIFGMYGLLLPLCGTFITLIMTIRYKKFRPILIIAVIIAPLFFYYVYPQISGDHPWMLRRYVFALVPATILISIYGLAQIRQNTIYKKLLVGTTWSLLLIGNLPATLTFFTYAENATLHEQAASLADLFGPHDLILIDQNAAGSGWSMITTPIRSFKGKHAVYFFNPQDLEQIDRSQFERTFLIVPFDNTDRYLTAYGDRMHAVTKYHIAIDQLRLSPNKTLPQKFPQKNSTIISGIIYEIY